MSEFGSYIIAPSPFPGVEDIILIFDTYGGLCNQMYDIINGINFCLHLWTFKTPIFLENYIYIYIYIYDCIFR